VKKWQRGETTVRKNTVPVLGCILIVVGLLACGGGGGSMTSSSPTPPDTYTIRIGFTLPDGTVYGFTQMAAQRYPISINGDVITYGQPPKKVTLTLTHRRTGEKTTYTQENGGTGSSALTYSFDVKLTDVNENGYWQPQQYDASLVVEDANGNVYTASKGFMAKTHGEVVDLGFGVMINNHPPVVRASASATSVCVGEAAIMTYSITDDQEQTQVGISQYYSENGKDPWRAISLLNGMRSWNVNGSEIRFIPEAPGSYEFIFYSSDLWGAQSRENIRIVITARKCPVALQQGWRLECEYAFDWTTYKNNVEADRKSISGPYTLNVGNGTLSGTCTGAVTWDLNGIISILTNRTSNITGTYNNATGAINIPDLGIAGTMETDWISGASRDAKGDWLPSYSSVTVGSTVSTHGGTVRGVKTGTTRCTVVK